MENSVLKDIINKVEHKKIIIKIGFCHTPYLFNLNFRYL